MVARLTSLAAVSAAVLLTGVMAQAAPMISNADFQTGDLTGWGTAATTIAADVGTPGNYAGRSTSLSNWGSLGGRGVGSIVAPEAGVAYTFEFDAMAADLTKTGTINVSIANGGWGSPTVSANVDVVHSALADGLWHHYALSYTPDNTTQLKVDIHGRGNGADIYFDNFVLAPVPEPTSMALFGLGGLALLRRKR